MWPYLLFIFVVNHAFVSGEVETVKTLDDLNSRYQKELKLVALEIVVGWCGPCRAMKVRFEEMSHNFTDVVFLMADADFSPDISKRYAVAAMPTFVLTKNFTSVDQIIGANEEKLRQSIEKNK